MPPDALIRLLQEAILLALVLALPILAAIFIASALSAVLQGALGVRDQTLGAAPRVAALFISFLVASPWIFEQLVSFSSTLFSAIMTLQR